MVILKEEKDKREMKKRKTWKRLSRNI